MDVHFFMYVHINECLLVVTKLSVYKYETDTNYWYTKIYRPTLSKIGIHFIKSRRHIISKCVMFISAYSENAHCWNLDYLTLAYLAYNNSRAKYD